MLQLGSMLPAPRILILRLSSLGDVILSTAALDAIRARAPEAKISWVVAKEFSDVLQGDPRIETLVSYDRKTSGFLEWHRLMRALFFSMNVRNGAGAGFDEVLDLHGSLRTRYARILFRFYQWRGLLPADGVWRTLPKPRFLRLGYFIFKRFWPATLRPGALGGYARRVAAFASHGNAVGVRCVPRLPALASRAMRPSALQWLSELDSELKLLSSGVRVCVMPGAAWRGKCLSTSKWVRVLSEFRNLQWVILGKPGEQASEALFRVAKNAGIPVHAAFRSLDLIEQARVVAGSSLLVGNDTGMAHLAEAQRVPVLTLFGPTRADLGFGPWQKASTAVESPLWCSPCSKDGRACFRWGDKRFLCQQKIPEATIVRAVREALRGAPGVTGAQGPGSDVGAISFWASPYRRVCALLSGMVRRVLSLRGWGNWNWRGRGAGHTARGTGRPVWFHAASAGELEMLWPVAAHLHRQGIPLGLSVFSPSGAASVERFKLEFSPVYAGPSPWEGEWRGFFSDSMGGVPSCIVTSKYEAWPELWGTAAEADVPLFILNADDRRSVRFAGKWVARIFGVGPRIFFGTVDHDSRMRIEAGTLRRWMSGPVEPLGDPRWDRVEARMAEARAPGSATEKEKRASQILRMADGAGLPRPWMVVGSSWKEDLDFLLPELRAARFSGTIWVVPHAVKDDAFQSQLKLLEQEYPAKVSRTSGWERASPVAGELIVVDELGVLVELYTRADMAWVGGGLRTGLHSVIEPAYAGIPVACGPQGSHRFPEVGALAVTGQLRVVDSTEGLADWLSWVNHQLLCDPASRSAMVDAWKKAYQLGASARAAQWILQGINRN